MRCCDKRLISKFVAKLVVDALHAIEIDERHRNAIPISMREFELLLSDRDEAVPIVEPGKRVSQSDCLK